MDPAFDFNMGTCRYGRIVTVDVSDISSIFDQKVQWNVECMLIISIHATDEPAFTGAAGQDGILSDLAGDCFYIF